MSKPMPKILLVILLTAFILTGCASSKPPPNIKNICLIFKDKPHWKRLAQKAEKRWQIPTSVSMAFIYQESAFVHNAKPPRKKLFGFIPRRKRQSTSVGYTQAINVTWQRYRQSVGNLKASRKNFADSLNFIGWYNQLSHKELKIPKNDAHHLYLAYHEGHGGYKSKGWAANRALQKIASRVEKRTKTYSKQLTRCGKRGRKKLS